MRRSTQRLRNTLFAILATGLSTAALGAPAPSQVRFQVSAEWLNGHRLSDQVRILDLRSEDDYRMSHIDGAVSLPIEQLFSNDKGKQYIASLNRIQKTFSGAGIDDDILVVVYDAGEMLSSTRAFWVFEVFGHTRVVVLDGGFKEWTGKHLPVSDKHIVPQPRAFVPKVTPDRLATKLTTRLAVGRSDTVIVDVRDRDQYVGEKSLTSRSGHIRSAINIPGLDVFDSSNDDRHLKSIDQLRALYANIDPSKSVVTYCNDGVRASATYFVLRRLGYNVANYDGAWLEWGNDTSLPIDAPALGAAQGEGM